MSHIYRRAAHALERVLYQGCSPKSAVYNLFPSKGYHKELPTVMALLVGTLKQYDELVSCLIQNGVIPAGDLPKRLHQEKSNFGKGVASGAKTTTRQATFIMLLMANDLLRGQPIRGGGALKRRLQAVPHLKEKLRAAVATEDKVERNEFPRYLRVDLSRVSRAEVIEAITSTFPGLVSSVDPLIDCVLVLKSREYDARLRQWSSMKDGRVVMMDRASCLSAKAADIQPGDIILDVCAAPGSKTLSYISCLYGSGVVVAIEKDESRFGTLLSRIAKESVFTVVQKVQARTYRLGPLLDLKEEDFLEKSRREGHEKVKGERKGSSKQEGGGYLFNTLEYPNLKCLCLLADFICDVCECPREIGVESVGVLRHCGRKWCLERMRDRLSLGREGMKVSLDPSCSGSGLLEHKSDMEKSRKLAARVTKLSSFQVSMLRKALSLPRVDICLYSTCSVFFEENEAVVAAALTNNFQVQKAIENWSNAPSNSLTPIPDRPPWVDLCVRAAPDEHKCRGFFLAKLLRSKT